MSLNLYHGYVVLNNEIVKYFISVILKVIIKSFILRITKNLIDNPVFEEEDYIV